MTATERALIAEAKRHDEAIRRKPGDCDKPGCIPSAHTEACTYQRDRVAKFHGERWAVRTLAALIDGYSRALDEVEYQRETIVVQRCAMHDQLDSEAADNERLRTELGELKLVLEQQDRDMERLRAALRELRFDVVRDLDCCNYVDRIDAILNPETPCTTTK